MMAESRRWIPSCLARNPLQFAVLEDYLNKMSEDLLLHPAAPPHMSRKKAVSFRKHPTCSGRNREHTRDAGPLRRETPHAARGPAGLDPPALLLLAQQSRRRGAAPLRKHARAIRPHGGGPGARGWGGLSSGSGPMKVHTLVSSHPEPIHQVGHTRELETGSTLRQPEKHYRVLAHARLIRGPGHPASRPLSEAGLCSFLPPSSYTSFASFLLAVHKASPCTSGSDPTCATALRKTSRLSALPALTAPALPCPQRGCECTPRRPAAGAPDVSPKWKPKLKQATSPTRGPNEDVRASREQRD